MIRFSLFALALTLSAPTHALPSLGTLDDNRTPRERELSGFTQGFAADINDSSQCSARAKQRFFGENIIPNESFVRLGNQGSVKAKVLVSDMAKTINRAMNALIANGDSEILRRRVCVGLYNWGQLNARSYEEGYILADPIAIAEMQSLPNRSMFSDQQVYLHEFAHQLQYRYGNIYATDVISRRSELTADCVGSALLALSWRGLSEELMNMESLGVVASAERVGDTNFLASDHHGTPEERSKMVRSGIQVVKAHYSLYPNGQGLTGRAILQRCAALVR
jgi:hypothetical protein